MGFWVPDELWNTSYEHPQPEEDINASSDMIYPWTLVDEKQIQETVETDGIRFAFGDNKALLALVKKCITTCME